MLLSVSLQSSETSTIICLIVINAVGLENAEMPSEAVAFSGMATELLDAGEVIRNESLIAMPEEGGCCLGGVVASPPEGERDSPFASS